MTDDDGDEDEGGGGGGESVLVRGGGGFLGFGCEKEEEVEEGEKELDEDNAGLYAALK